MTDGRGIVVLAVVFVWMNAVGVGLSWLGWITPATGWGVTAASAVVALVGWTALGLQVLRE